MEIRNGIIFFDTKAEFEAYVSDANNVSITNYPVYIGDTKEIITHNVTYKDASEIDASQITSGTISVDRLPAGSLERCVVVANESARFALTTNDVQDGDTVKQSDTGVMYMVVDVNNLNSDAGYLTYTAVTNWESIANKPEFDYVKYSEQELTDEQKQIARENIGVPTKVSELENDKNYLENGSGIIANGIYIYDTLGRFTLPENWDTSQNDLAVGVAVVHDHGAFVVAGDNNAYISKPISGWAEGVAWGGYGTDIPTLQNFETAENARSDFDGVNNTKKIVEALGENCAAYYATQFVFKNGKSGYLPSYGEAFVLSSSITEINTAFSVIGTELDRYSDTYLAAHTSTELNANECIISDFCYDFSGGTVQSKDCTSWFGNCQPTSHSDYYLGVLPFLHVEKEDLLIKTNGDGTNLLADDGEYKAIKTVNGESLLGEGNIDVEHLVEVTYEELYDLKHNSRLIPGVKYKITNYHCAFPVLDNSLNIEKMKYSIKEPLDIITTATDKNDLSKDCIAVTKLNTSTWFTTSSYSDPFYNTNISFNYVVISDGDAYLFLQKSVDAVCVDNKIFYRYETIPDFTSDFTSPQKEYYYLQSENGVVGESVWYGGQALEGVTVFDSCKPYFLWKQNVSNTYCLLQKEPEIEDEVFVFESITNIVKNTIETIEYSNDQIKHREFKVDYLFEPFFSEDYPSRFKILKANLNFEDYNMSISEGVFSENSAFDFPCYLMECFDDGMFLAVLNENGLELKVGDNAVLCIMGSYPIPIGTATILEETFYYNYHGFIDKMEDDCNNILPYDFVNMYYLKNNGSIVDICDEYSFANKMYCAKFFKDSVRVNPKISPRPAVYFDNSSNNYIEQNGNGYVDPTATVFVESDGNHLYNCSGLNSLSGCYRNTINNSSDLVLKYWKNNKVDWLLNTTSTKYYVERCYVFNIINLILEQNCYEDFISPGSTGVVIYNPADIASDSILNSTF